MTDQELGALVHAEIASLRNELARDVAQKIKDAAQKQKDEAEQTYWDKTIAVAKDMRMLGYMGVALAAFKFLPQIFPNWF